MLQEWISGPQESMVGYLLLTGFVKLLGILEDEKYLRGCVHRISKPKVRHMLMERTLNK